MRTRTAALVALALSHFAAPDPTRAQARRAWPEGPRFAEPTLHFAVGVPEHAAPDRPFQAAVDRQLGQGSGAPTGAVVLGASLGATVGALAGGWLGYQAGKGSGGEDPGLLGAVYGGVLGSAVGAPLGPTIAADPEGSFANGLAGSLLGGLAGLGLGAAAGGELTGLYLAPLLEIVGASLMVLRS